MVLKFVAIGLEENICNVCYIVLFHTFELLDYIFNGLVLVELKP